MSKYKKQYLNTGGKIIYITDEDFRCYNDELEACFVCPRCKITLIRDFDFCPKCGCMLEWHESTQPIINKY